jgi:hypothetical protein
LGCPLGLTFRATEYSKVISLPANAYSHPGGYLFHWQSCCRNPGIVNIQNPVNSGSVALTFFPPVMDSLGNQIANTSPFFNNPISDYAVNLVPFSLSFGGNDPDGDSLSYELFTPFDDGFLSQGIITPEFAPYTDPRTHVPSAFWSPGYNQNNQIPGFPGPAPSPNRLQIDPLTGTLSMIPNIGGNGIFAYGIACKEYRNGKLIAVTYRDNVIYVANNLPNPIVNQAPDIIAPSNQPLANWSGDTLIFTGSPVCVQLDITDPDTVADIQLVLALSDYDTSDVSFLQSSAVIRNNDTFSTAICFAPDSFIMPASQASLLAIDNLCHHTQSDSLIFWFKFVGASNAGWGGRQNIDIAPSLGAINMFGRLTGNPNPGGIWIDLDSTGLINANNQFIANYINSPVSYDFMYIDQQPNYPPDTALLTLNFVMPSGLENSPENDVSIYPNPSNGNVTIQVHENLIGAEAEVYSYDLKRIQSFRIENQRSNIQIEKSGLYFIRIEGQSGMQKVIIEN